MRQKNQVELNLDTGAKGEAPNAAAQETEARAAGACLERPAVHPPRLPEWEVPKRNPHERRLRAPDWGPGAAAAEIGELAAERRRSAAGADIAT